MFSRIDNTKQRFFKARRKTVAFYQRPASDISHLSILVVIFITLISGASASFGTQGQVTMNQFASANNIDEPYSSMNDQIILEADSVVTVASIYSDNLGQDALKQAEALYAKADVVAGGSNFLTAMPIVETASTAVNARSNITSYVVQGGDTLSSIGKQFNITTDTIRYANKLDDEDQIKPGQTLTILPATGLMHTVAAGETLAGIAANFKANEAMITAQNDLYGEDLTSGMQIFIPDGEIPEAISTTKPATNNSSSSGSRSSSSGISYVKISYGPNHFPYGWCTWWVAQKRYVPWFGNAWQWYRNSQAYGRAVGKTPVPGAIMVTWESGYGHVAYVESVDGNKFTVSEMNYVGFGVVSKRTLTTSSVPLIGFIY